MSFADNCTHVIMFTTAFGNPQIMEDDKTAKITVVVLDFNEITLETVLFKVLFILCRAENPC